MITPEAPTSVEVGQVWADSTGRRKGHTVVVVATLAIDGRSRYAALRVLADADKPTSTSGFTRLKRIRISPEGCLPGYRLVASSDGEEA